MHTEHVYTPAQVQHVLYVKHQLMIEQEENLQCDHQKRVPTTRTTEKKASE